MRIFGIVNLYGDCPDYPDYSDIFRDTCPQFWHLIDCSCSINLNIGLKCKVSNVYPLRYSLQES